MQSLIGDILQQVMKAAILTCYSAAAAAAAAATAANNNNNNNNGDGNGYDINTGIITRNKNMKMTIKMMITIGQNTNVSYFKIIHLA